MKIFILNLILFFFVLLLSVEFYIRYNNLTIDLPQRTVNESNIQKYKPNQSGYWNQGEHTWSINSEGWPGILPSSFDNLITLIGDSHIENFMNPDSCHIGFLLNHFNKKNNFIEASRSGVSLIEMFEIANYLELNKNIKMHFLFVKESDFKESIVELGRRSDTTQMKIENGQIFHGILKYPNLKYILYNFKTLYYLYTELQKSPRSPNTDNGINKNEQNNNDLLNYFELLLNSIKNKYNTNNFLILLHPETSDQILLLFKKHNFNVYRFHTENPLLWRHSENDRAHWSCFGFNEASKQIINYIDETSL